VDAVACSEATRGKRQSQRSRPWINCRVGSAQVPGWLVECLRLGVGMPAPPGQIPPPWARWENEAPATRAAGRPVPGDSRCVLLRSILGAATRACLQCHSSHSNTIAAMVTIAR
jgi:hypothetical protein